ncbi:hypothetical protein LXL04_018628 [Taraxacum kok-saghyz]
MLPRETKGPIGEQREDQGGWSEIRRKGKKQQHENGYEEPVTSFYVSNLPEGVTKTKIRYAFVQFGKVVDIYIGGKRDRSGSIFAFVRFANVNDAKALEREMSKNIPKTDTSRRVPPASSTNTVPWHPIRTHKTFADAVAGAQTHNQHIASRPIAITPAGHTKGWDDCVMIGEPISLQHIAELPSLFYLDGNPTGKIHYIGGTNVLIKFINKEAARAFYGNEHNWNRWFKWIKMGFNDDLPQERLAWVTVFRLPIRFRSENNYEIIANRNWKPYDQPVHIPQEIDEESNEDDMEDNIYYEVEDEVDDSDGISESEEEEPNQKDDPLEEGEMVEDSDEAFIPAMTPEFVTPLILSLLKCYGFKNIS